MLNMSVVSRLNAAVCAVCPIHGVAIGDENDRSTWRVDFDDAASSEQRSVALRVVATFDPSEPAPEAVDAERDRRLQTVFFSGKAFDFCDGTSEVNIAGAATLALAAIVAGAQPGNMQWAGTGSDFRWIAQDNSIVPMDAQTMLAFGQHAAAWKAQHIFAARALKDTKPIPADYASDARWPS